MGFIYNNQGLKFRRQTLRNNAPEPEQILWYYLRGKNLKSYKFRRQYSVGAYVLDFYCPKLRLALEIDGDSHFTAKGKIYDQIRTQALTTENIKVLRFTNTEIRDNIEGVIEEILKLLP